MKLNWKWDGVVEGATVITTIDAHAAGEPLRIVTGGLPPLVGNTILEKRRYMQQHLDYKGIVLYFVKTKKLFLFYRRNELRNYE